MKTVLIILVLLLLLVLIIPSLTGLSLMELFRGRVDPSEVDFSSLKRSDSPNDYLMAPERFKSRSDEISPVFSVSADRLKSEWLQIVENQPRTRLFHEYSPFKLQIVQRSQIFRFPDVITIRFIEISEERSTLAVYSRSVYGYSDLGVNKKRVESWIELLQERISSSGS